MTRLTLSRVVSILFVFCAATAIASPAQILTTLHSFAGFPSDGAIPYAGLVQGSDGNFYGTTYYGGANNNCYTYTCGTVFKMTPGGALTTLHSFAGYPEGCYPYAGLVQGSDGNFYGTTYGCGANGYGTVFRITSSGDLTTLHSFDLSDGTSPTAALVQGSDGNFYGTTYYGGPNVGGTVFKITPSGTLTLLYSFSGPDGWQPYAGLVQASDGNFYGTTYEGGPNVGGTVFKITPSGTLTLLYSFSGPDGWQPYAGLVQASDGNFYGTTYEGGANNEGTIFKITPSGILTLLYSFAGSDGANPVAGLVQASDGNFYGTTYEGGANNEGTIFKITPNGTLTTLYSFCSQTNCADGSNPYAGLVQASDGNLYGTTYVGGANGDGAVFLLNALVNLSPTSLNFGPQGTNLPDTPLTVTLTNTGGAPLLVSSIVITGTDSGDFSETNNCPTVPGTLTPGSYCSITVVFAPTGSGMLNADVAITDNAPDSPQVVPLTGVGVGGKVRPK